MGIAVTRDGGRDGRIDVSAARRSGATIGASIAIVAVAAALVVGPILAPGLAAPAPGLGAWFVLAGVPAAAIAGWIVGPRTRRREGFVGAALTMVILTTSLADAMIVVAWVTLTVGLTGANATPIGTALAGVIVLWSLGLVLVGIPMLFLTVPCGLVWTELTRRVAGAAAERERIG